MNDTNIILATDSYKLSHYRQYPPDTTKVYSYFESRNGAKYDETVFFGLQYLLLEYLAGSVVTQEKIDEAEEIANAHMGPGNFNREGWEYILNEHHGRLPVRIRAVPEGSVVNVSNALMTVENTDPKCFWLTSYLETMLVQTWYPSTVATQSRQMKKDLLRYLERTGGNALDSGLEFMLHDFGYRGVTSQEQAALGSAAHLINFKGSDTLAAIPFLRKYYYESEMPAFSVPASEHSTMTAWTREREVKAYENMLDTYPEGIVSIVSDSYDIYRAVGNHFGKTLHDKVSNRNGRVVIRPDSGDPKIVLPRILESLYKSFGGSRNDAGFVVLPDYIRVLQGDGIDADSITEILDVVADAGFAAENLVFGSGGGLLQKVNRDTQRFAFKASYAETDLGPVDVYKDPVGGSKSSKRGRLKLVRTTRDKFTTVAENAAPSRPCEMQLVFENGGVYNTSTFDEVRYRARI